VPRAHAASNGGTIKRTASTFFVDRSVRVFQARTNRLFSKYPKHRVSEVSLSVASGNGASAAVEAKSAPFSLTLADATSVRFPFSVDAANTLLVETDALMESFRALKEQNALPPNKRRPQKSLEYVGRAGDVRLMVDCNPNLFPDAMSARVYVSIQYHDMKMFTEGLLTVFISEVRNFVQSNS